VVSPRLAPFAGAGGAFGYALLVAFILGLLHVTVWLGGIFFPVVLVLPIIVVLVRQSQPVLTIATYSLIGLLGVYAGDAVATSLAVQPASWPLEWISMVGAAAYDLLALAVAITIAVLVANVASVKRTPLQGSGFSFFAAWIAFVAMGCVGAAYMFGTGVRSCGSANWGYLYVMYAPLLLYARPFLMAAPLLAFACGGILPRYLSLNRTVTTSFLLLAMFAAGLFAFFVTVPSAQPCSPL
jgi:hypothetical protein